jgi:hypothetical protein
MRSSPYNRARFALVPLRCALELMAALAQMIAMDANTPTERPAEFLGLLLVN